MNLNMQNKICPKLLAGYLSNPNIDVRALMRHINKISDIRPDPLPRCLKEECALWIPKYLDKPGYCGLRKS